jgi:hypothetical protein
VTRGWIIRRAAGFKAQVCFSGSWAFPSPFFLLRGLQAVGRQQLAGGAVGGWVDARLMHGLWQA